MDVRTIPTWAPVARYALLALDEVDFASAAAGAPSAGPNEAVSSAVPPSP
jgi:hypothetical protein